MVKTATKSIDLMSHYYRKSVGVNLPSQMAPVKLAKIMTPMRVENVLYGPVMLHLKPQKLFRLLRPIDLLVHIAWSSIIIILP